jgi:hypothetical protein
MTPLKALARTLLAAALLAPCVIAQAAPQYKQPADGKPAGDLLTEGLDDLLNPTPPPANPSDKQSKQPSWTPDERMLNDLIQDSLQGGHDWGEDLGQQQESPLVRVEKNMTEATRLIGRPNESSKTAGVQEQIVTDLDALIKEMEKQCNSSGSQSNKPPEEKQGSQRSKPQQAASQPKPGKGKPSPGKPSQSQSSIAAQQSSMRLGSADAAEVERRSIDQLMKEAWGHLPERLREQMLQGSSGEFLPKYKEEIERYYQRLAEEEARESGSR